MRIIIVGCGKVGYVLTEQLTKEGHDICLIDKDEDKLARKEAKIKSLEMENELMRDFLSLTERK